MSEMWKKNKIFILEFLMFYLKIEKKLKFAPKTHIRVCLV